MTEPAPKIEIELNDLRKRVTDICVTPLSQEATKHVQAIAEQFDEAVRKYVNKQFLNMPPRQKWTIAMRAFSSMHLVSLKEAVIWSFVEGAQQKTPKPEKQEDKLIMVCERCLQASCWQGEYLCDHADGAGSTLRPISELKKLGLEDPSWWIEDGAQQNLPPPTEIPPEGEKFRP